MEHLSQLLKDLEEVSLQDISQVPSSQQHVIAEKIETLQDELRELIAAQKKNLH